MGSSGRRVLLISGAVNVLIYVCRYLIAGALPEVQKSYSTVSKEQLGWLAATFVITYLLASLVFGALGDGRFRLRLMSVGAAIAALATTAVGLTRSFQGLWLTRPFLGVGQAAFVALAPAAIADAYPLHQRAGALGLFNVGIPVGTASSYVIVGLLLALGLRWQGIFVAVGVPTLLVGLWLFSLREAATRPTAPITGMTRWLALLKNRSLMINVLAGSANAFAMGGLAYWMPSYLHQERKLSLQSADMAFGLITAGAGSVGTIGGGYLGNLLVRRTHRAHGLLAGLFALLAVPVIVVFMQTPLSPAMWLWMGLGITLLFVPTSPSLTLIMDVTPIHSRASANALNMVLVHLLGESFSPVLMEALADRGDMNTGLSAAAFAVAIGGLLWLCTTPFLPGDMARARAATQAPQSEDG